MVFKLVRIDNPESQKITLDAGKHVIGRGKFLSIDDLDMRVSRNHAELEVTESSLKLRSTHKNPCFYLKNASTETQLLLQDTEVTLSNGDKFGLLPDHLWFEVIHISDDEAPQNNCAMDANKAKEGNGYDDVEKGACDSTLKLPDDCIKQESPDPGSTSPSLLGQSSTQDYNVEPNVPSENMSSPMKRSLSTDDEDVAKKVKVEPQETKDEIPGPSNDQPGSSSDDVKKDGVPQQNADGANGAGGSPQNRPLRERCMYGANCYRRNPEHKAQFSHPTDGDWGDGSRGVCPWGAACRRRHAAHWNTHQHPPGVQPPDPNAPRPQPGNKRKPRPKKVYDSDDSVTSPNSSTNLVTGKRVRKTISRVSWSGSEDDADPYGTDESDEWMPPSDFTDTQEYTEEYSQ